MDGKFVLDVPAGSQLEISYVGFEPQIVTATPGTPMNIVLKDNSETLNELVVVGYGVQKKSDVTGSVTSIGKDRIGKIPVTNVLQAVQGAAAGVTIMQTSSIPGDAPDAMVRGQNSINASSGPYIVVDGVPISKSGGTLNDINPNDIESMEILKDASATAIYATNGSNGVSQMGRLNYSYDSRYLFTVTVRRDGSSVFGDNNKYGVFPSVALGWNITNESFMKKTGNWLNNLKLRLSYGKTGNEAIGVYQSLAKMDAGMMAFGGLSTPGLWLNGTMGNANLSWEQTKTFNVGVDFRLWNNRLSGNVDVYFARTNDLLLKRTLWCNKPDYSGEFALDKNGFRVKVDDTNKVTGSEFTMKTGDKYVIAEDDSLNRFSPYTLKWGAYDPKDDFGYAMVKDWPLMRLGETYLLRAEARFRQGNYTGAAEDINKLRDRAFKDYRAAGHPGAGAVNASDVQNGSIDFILDERARELFGEENRRYTLMRTKTLAERLKNYADNYPEPNKYGNGANCPADKMISGFNDNKSIFPIPRTDIDLNKDGNLEQNTGY